MKHYPAYDETRLGEQARNRSSPMREEQCLTDKYWSIPGTPDG